MHHLSFPYTDLNLVHGIAHDYLERTSDLKPFIHDFPSHAAVRRVAENRAKSFSHRAPLHAALMDQYHNIPNAEAALANIECLLDENTVTITTGHQICIGTGPLFVIYKIASVIAACRHLNEANQGIKYVPVFWMATEDHDLEEIAHFFRKGEKRFWQTQQTGPVGRMNTQGINALFSDIPLPQQEWLTEAYSKATLAEATRSLIHQLFGDHGLIILDADHRSLKALFAPYMLQEIKEQKAREPLAKASEQLTALGYSPQVSARDINLFWIEGHHRERLEPTIDGSFRTHVTGKVFSMAELEMHLHANPQCFSPNVILRPLYQEVILPNAAYIGGPGELAYWLQLKQVFHSFQVPMPIVILRNNALIVSSLVKDRIQKLGWQLSEFFTPVAEQEKRIVGELPQDAFRNERDEIHRAFTRIHDVLGATDATLKATVWAEEKKALTGLDALEKKWHKAIRQKEETKLNQWSRIRKELFPDNHTQDRTTNLFDFPQGINLGLIDYLINEFDPFHPTYICVLE
jgi:bacillithiol synthase